MMSKVTAMRVKPPFKSYQDMFISDNYSEVEGSISPTRYDTMELQGRDTSSETLAK